MADPPKDDHYRSLAGPGEATLKEKGSVFHAYAVPVAGEEEAGEKLAQWWKTHHDATHIGWARRLAPPPDGAERFDDDGEPHGSTGPPILQAITGRELWGVLVGVVRWYGGTKLGVGGLIRAYGGAAAEALDRAKKRRVSIVRRVRVEVPHDRAGAVYALADKRGVRMGRPDYTESGLVLQLEPLQSKAYTLAEEIEEVTAGRASVSVADTWTLI